SRHPRARADDVEGAGPLLHLLDLTDYLAEPSNFLHELDDHAVHDVEAFSCAALDGVKPLVRQLRAAHTTNIRSSSEFVKVARSADDTWLSRAGGRGPTHRPRPALRDGRAGQSSADAGSSSSGRGFATPTSMTDSSVGAADVEWSDFSA